MDSDPNLAGDKMRLQKGKLPKPDRDLLELQFLFVPFSVSLLSFRGGIVTQGRHFVKK